MTDRASLADVAREAGVHPSTASRALNPSTQTVVRPQTVARVKEAAERLGYRPHPMARGLRTDQTFTVGLVVPDLENPLFPPLVRGAESALSEGGYSLFVANTDNDPAHKAAVVAALADRRVDGFILATAELSSPIEERLNAGGTPVVLVNRELPGTGIPAIVSDDRTGVGLAVDHLIELGHRRIGHVAGPAEISTGLGRAESFRAHMARHGLTAEDRIEAADWFGVEPGAAAAARLFDRHPDVTAVVAGNDLLALGTIHALGASGRRVPDDVSVTGYNDMPYVDLLQPPLTTVCVPYRIMGEMAGRALLELIADSQPVPSEHLKPKLTVRASTAPPR